MRGLHTRRSFNAKVKVWLNLNKAELFSLVINLYGDVIENSAMKRKVVSLISMSAERVQLFHIT